MNNEIYIRRRNKVAIPSSQQGVQLTDEHLVAFQKNLEGLGYALSSDALKAIKQLTITDVANLHGEMIKTLKQLVGAHVKYKPMYPNFPEQVAKASSAELYINAYLHYFGDWLGVRILPGYKKISRPELTDKVKLRVIEPGDADDFNSIFTNLVSSKTSMSATDAEDAGWFIENKGESVLTLLPEEIPNKENLAIITSYIINHTELPADTFSHHFRTATDVLRLINALSGGNVSLADKTKYTRLSRKQRRMILELLENAGNVTEDMLRYKEEWKRVGERLHPGEYRKRFPKTFESFEVLRNNLPFETFNGKVEQALKNGDIAEALALLKLRPGDLARRLDHMLRLSSDQEQIISAFSDAIPKVSTTVLLQVSAHFKGRNQKNPIRVFFPKGNVGKARAVENDLPKLSEESRRKVMSACRQALLDHYSKLPPLGRVYVDRQLKQYTVPLTLRSASRSLRTLGRGSKLYLPKGNTIRFFIWWKDGMKRTDIDLSALALDKDSAFKLQIAYYNLKELGGYHSGDITSAPKGASEFIDIETNRMLGAGVRYIVMSVNSYTEQPFYELPECFAGFMMRQSASSGEIYDPRTVEHKIDITANTRACLPFIIDLESRTVLWTDLAVTHNPSTNNNVLNNMSTLTILNQAMRSLVKPSLYDLFMLHGEARGEVVKSKKEADTIFSVSEGVTPFQTDVIVGKFV